MHRANKSKEISLKWRVSKKEAGMRLLQFLREKCPESPSVKTLKRAIDDKFCTVNDRIEIFSSYRLEENDVVMLNTLAFEKTKKALAITIPILYEDQELLIINKPPGLISDIAAIKKGLPKESLNLVHRLDKETSGVLILAKTPEMKEKMILLFKKLKVRKLYLAIVDKVLEKDEGKIDNFLGEKHHYQGQTIYGSVEEKKGRHAITYWKCLAKGKNACIVSCEPYTGRTHQLRVHLSSLGHPILGDIQYGKKFFCSYRPQRNLLHAYCIVFEHPTTRKSLKVIAPIPVDFKQAMEAIKVTLDGASY